MRKNFTLIELLVVILIIGVLTALLLPAISGVSREASNIQCVSRLRDLGTIEAMYLKRTKSISEVSDKSDRKESWFMAMAEIGVIKAGLGDIGMCPEYLSVRYPQYNAGETSLAEQMDPNVGETYGMPVGKINTKRIRDAKTKQMLPSGKLVMIAESFGGSGDKKGMLWKLSSSGADIALMHGDSNTPKGNAWFLDGHVESLRAEEFGEKQLLLPKEVKNAGIPDQAEKIKKVVVPDRMFEDIAQTLSPEYPDDDKK